MTMIKLNDNILLDIERVQCVQLLENDILVIWMENGSKQTIEDKSHEMFERLEKYARLSVQGFMNDAYDEYKRSKFRKNQCKGECHD